MTVAIHTLRLLVVVLTRCSGSVLMTILSTDIRDRDRPGSVVAILQCLASVVGIGVFKTQLLVKISTAKGFRLGNNLPWPLPEQNAFPNP